MTEDQLMEDFTFGVASRLLGVQISTGEDEELMNQVPFNRYQSKQRQAPLEPVPSSAALPTQHRSWLGKLFGKKADKK